MSNFVKFKSWLELNKPNSLTNYISGYNRINKIIQMYGLIPFEDITLDNFEKLQKELDSIDEYIEINKGGNNMYSATLMNYKKYLMDNNNLVIPIIEKPFPEFGWRWATTGIVSYLNQPVYLKIVLDAILINGNGELNQTKEFKKLVARIAEKKYGVGVQDIDKISKLSNSNDIKNIIENSGSYWSNLGLLSVSGQKALVSDLGISFVQGELSNSEFLNIVIESYKIPNNNYKSFEIQCFSDFGIELKPFKILLGTLRELYLLGENNSYLTETELAKVIVPLSIIYQHDSCFEISRHVLKFRKDPLEYNVFPDCTSTYFDDKGNRMLNEYLYFLECFGALTSELGLKTVRTSEKKYFLSKYLLENIETEKTKEYDKKNKILPIKQTKGLEMKGFVKLFTDSLEKANLYFDPVLTTRFVTSLVTKPFVLLNGLSGSGKTKLAQAFVQWLCQEESQYNIIPVGADWTNREPLLGYPDGLNATMYVTPDNGALQLMLDAQNNPNLPFFMILDEMNLSHVERYFADFLSIMESEDSIKLYTGNIRSCSEGREIPQTIMWPNNLFIIGTVNIDETTYMFSPKVLDRANVIEFRLSENELERFFNLTGAVNLSSLVSGGAIMSEGFLTLANSEFKTNDAEVQSELVKFFSALSNVGAEFGYRTANEVLQLINQLGVLDSTMDDNAKIDIAIMQKLLPKLHGSRSKIVKVLATLEKLCLLDAEKFDITQEEQNNANIKYPISYAKLRRMYHNVIANGFTSYAEA